MDFEKIEEISRKISYSETKKKELGDFLRNIGYGFKISEVNSKDNLKVAGVDGGIVKRSLHGFDFILARAVGVYFEYINGKIGRVEYFPSKQPDPELFFMESANESDWRFSPSITRQAVEIDCALKLAGKFKPELLLLDGSVVPHYSDRPGNDASVYQNYLRLISRYESLFRFCQENGILLAGVVEDSRGNRFCNFIEKDVFPNIKHETDQVKILKTCRYTGLLFWILKKGERTDVFNYSDSPKDHPVLSEFGDFEINTFYMKTAEYDRPVRIDFLGGKDLIGSIADSVYSISSQHSGYGIPSVLIEADQAARLGEEEISSVVEEISFRSGNPPGVFDLRRDSRPF